MYWILYFVYPSSFSPYKSYMLCAQIFNFVFAALTGVLTLKGLSWFFLLKPLFHFIVMVILIDLRQHFFYFLID